MKSIQDMGCYPEKFLYLPNNKPISLSIEDSLSKSIGTVKLVKVGLVKFTWDV